ncbi:MAG: RNA-binding S4 domain-containing protein [Bacteroidota bacterium]
MRVDKFLWCVRYFKTRSLATAACKKGQIKVNGENVKPSREIFPLDEVTLRKNQIEHRLTVLALPENRVGAKLVGLFVNDITPKAAFEHAELVKLAKQHYRKGGTGRPTKKDRRDIEDYLYDPEGAQKAPEE